MTGPTRGPEATVRAVNDAGRLFAEMLDAIARGFAEAVGSNDHPGAETIARAWFRLADAWDDPEQTP